MGQGQVKSTNPQSLSLHEKDVSLVHLSLYENLKMSFFRLSHITQKDRN